MTTSKYLYMIIGAVLYSAQAWSAFITPETQVTIDLSSRDTNRFVCTDGPINDVYYSEEKGIVREIDGNNVFIKFKIKSNGVHNEYITASSEFFIICAGETYSVIAEPQPHLPAQTHRLGNPSRKRADHSIEIFGALSMEERAVKATILVYKGNSDALRKVKPRNHFRFWREDIVPDAVVSNYATYKVEGFGLRVKEYRVEAQADIHALQEINFLTPILSERILAITVIPQQLEKGQVARVFIVEKEFEQ